MRSHSCPECMTVFETIIELETHLLEVEEYTVEEVEELIK